MTVPKRIPLWPLAGVALVLLGLVLLFNLRGCV